MGSLSVPARSRKTTKPRGGFLVLRKHMPILLKNTQSLYENYENCTPKDPETGCRACGDNARSIYEQCRQSYFLKEQNKILQSQQNSQSAVQQQNTAQQKEINAQELEQKNQELQNQIDILNKKINTQNTSLQTPKMEASISTYFIQSITKPDVLNIGLYSALIIVVLLYLILKKARKPSI
jgi:hypothetical protein